MFSADFSSSPSSTPGQEPPRRNPLFSSNVAQHPSTTPAAPPPSQLFGSSSFGTGVSRLAFPKPTSSSSPPLSNQRQRTKDGMPVNSSFRSFKPALGQSTASDATSRYTEESYEENDDEMQEDGADYDDDETTQSRFPQDFQALNNPPSLMKFSTNSTRMARSAGPRRSLRSTNLSRLPTKGKDSTILDLARDLGARSKPATITESDEAIYKTEQTLRALEEQLQYLKDSSQAQAVISEHAQQLLEQWQSFARVGLNTPDPSLVGPLPSAPAFDKAKYLASLLLTLHHDEDTALPQQLMDWLDENHLNYEFLYSTVAAARPNCTSHELFWDAAQSLLARGKITHVMKLFEEADFRFATSATDDGADEPGYKGSQLQAIQSVIYRARLLLNSSPIVQNGDYNIAGTDWDIFRTQVQAELDNLTDLASMHNEDDDDNAFEAENFGLHKPGTTLSTRLGRKSAGAVPWTIFQNLRITYSILLGSTEEITAQAQDWLEASMLLTVWWDGASDVEVAQWSFDVSRANNMALEKNGFNPYLCRLRDSFLHVTDPENKDSFQLNTMSPVEVGLGAILQGSISSALVVLRALSQCVAAACADVGLRAGYFVDERSSKLAGFSEEDLMVLNYGAPDQSTTHDAILLSYADALFEKQILRVPGEQVEGWEISISIVTRLSQQDATAAAVSKYINLLALDNNDRTEKLISLCEGLNLESEARNVSDRYGDHLVNNTTDYGTALLCYARARSQNKIRSLIDLLNSYSLVQSRAYPPEDEIDAGLLQLVSNPRTALADINEVDPVAAEMLQFYLAGYACIRRFYTLRDNGDENSSSPRPLAQHRAAAKTLIAAINSGADSIYGGLYDAERRSAIQVDGLLTLLGEATAFLSTSPLNISRKTVFSAQQIYALLAAIEDLSTVSQRVFAATEDCLLASLRQHRGSNPPSPRDMLKKSMSSGGESQFSFSMMGNEMLSREGSGILVSSGNPNMKESWKLGAQNKGWDWRDGFKGNVKGEDVIKTLRIGLAIESSLVKLEGGD